MRWIRTCSAVALAGVTCAVAASSCSSTVTAGGCAVGETDLCEGPAGCVGHRSCGDDKSWSECLCSDGDASTTGGAGGAGGAGASTGGAGAASGSGGAGAIATCRTDLAGPAMIPIPAGLAEIGSTALPAAQPVHTVDVASFCLDRTEVTVRDYLECFTAAGSAACTAPSAPVGSTYTTCNFGVSGYEDHPVNCITWEQADQYCKWAGKRLPTETEWEYAARGALGRNYPWGNTDPPNPITEPTATLLANWFTQDTVPVGSYPAGATPEGVQDMAGNVWEWIADLWCPTYDTASTDCSTVNHSARGGSWASQNTEYLRSWYRDGDVAADARFGFRCAL